MTSYRNVCEVIVPNDLCIGCGLCIGVCPPNVLEMRFNEYGEYIAFEYKEGCLPKCDLCLRACPFWNQEDNEDTLSQQAFAKSTGIDHRKETGYVLDCYVGYSKKKGQRSNGASGGLATWFLQKLIEDNIVDKVVTVSPNQDVDKLYQYSILSSPEEIQAASRSCYYPVEIGTVIQQIISAEDARYAVVGLPCFLKGLRLAMRKNRRLRNRLSILIGLTCGQAKSKFFVEYLTALKGGNAANLTNVQFREKADKRPATDYGHKLTWQNGSEEEREATIFWTEGIEQAWTHNYFQPNSCNFCDDIFAETADVTFMDAWLPEYVQDHQGHSLIINRNSSLESLWSQALFCNDVLLKKIDVDSVINSQAGVLHEKRDGLQYRLSQKQNEEYVIKKRFPPLSKGNIFDRRLWDLKSKASRLSRELWQKDKNLNAFQNGLRWISGEIWLIHTGKRINRTFRQGRFKSALLKRVRKLIAITKENK